MTTFAAQAEAVALMVTVVYSRNAAYQSRFPLEPDGTSLRAALVDEEYCLSDAMPGCQLHLSSMSPAEFTKRAQTEPDPKWHPPHLAEAVVDADAANANAEDADAADADAADADAAAPAGGEGAPGGQAGGPAAGPSVSPAVIQQVVFLGLEAGATYYLYVDEGEGGAHASAAAQEASASKLKEAAAEAEAARKAHEARLRLEAGICEEYADNEEGLDELDQKYREFDGLADVWGGGAAKGGEDEGGTGPGGMRPEGMGPGGMGESFGVSGGGGIAVGGWK